MSVKDRIISKHYSEIAKKSAQARLEKYGPGYMAELSKKAVAAHQRNARMRMPVVNLDNPEKNCRVCGYDHGEITDMNRKAYKKAHEKHIKKLINGRVAE